MRRPTLQTVTDAITATAIWTLCALLIWAAGYVVGFPPPWLTTEARSETVDVKYRDPVDLKTFACTDTPRSSFIQRVCYDKAQSYMVINLRGTYYHYCELPPATFDSLMGAPSMGQFYNQNIKGSGSVGPYDCRTHRVPSY